MMLSTQVEDLINYLSYDLDEVIEDVKFVNPEFPDSEAQYVPLIGGEGPHWKSKLKEILSSHYDLHFGCNICMSALDL